MRLPSILSRKRRSQHAARRHPSRQFADCYEGTTDYDAENYAATGAPFVVLKATESIGHIDIRHAVRCEASHLAGLAVGHYHFFRGSQTRRPEWEARLFWETVKPHFDVANGGDFLIVDVEREGGTVNVVSELDSFVLELARLLRLDKVRATIVGYSEKSLLEELPSLDVPGSRWWVADYPDFPGSPGHGRILWAHQYTEDGSVSGVSSPTDLSVLVDRTSIKYWARHS